MAVTTDRLPPNSASRQPLLRLRLNPADAPSGLLDGAWWPRSRDLARELPALVEVLGPLWGRITRIAVNPAHWPVIPRKVPVDGHVVKVGWFTEQDPHELLLLSRQIGRWDLLVIPPETDSVTARRLMSATLAPRRLAPASALIEAETARHVTASGTARSGAHPPEQEWEGEGGAIAGHAGSGWGGHGHPGVRSARWPRGGGTRSAWR